MATLLLRLAAPLQSWGSKSKFNLRMTEREPTKSGVIGMIAAALGIQRNENSEMLKLLSEMKFGVRVEKEGKLLKDFHMVHELKNSHLTERYYLSDAVFIAALETDDTELLKSISDALKKPVYPLFLGRRSCPPTLPVFLEIREEDLISSLKNTLSLYDKSQTKRIVYEAEHDGVLVQDEPVSFSQLHRIHGYRMKKEEIMKLNEHDPFEEL